MKTLGPLSFEQHKEFIAPIISRLEFFAALSREQLDKMLFFIKFVQFEAGETVIEKDAPGDSFFVIYAGQVEVRVPGFLGAKVLSTMGPGDFFGELALILNQPRSASIVCMEATQCFMLDRADFAQLMAQNPDIAQAIKDIARSRFGG